VTHHNWRVVIVTPKNTIGGTTNSLGRLLACLGSNYRYDPIGQPWRGNHVHVWTDGKLTLFVTWNEG
jgi:hypothetical protein